MSIEARLSEEGFRSQPRFVSCLTEGLSLCTVLIGDQCDCEGGSSVDIGLDSFSVRWEPRNFLNPKP